MKPNIPHNNKLSTGKLASVFNNTAASYKFYWFISLLQLFLERNNERISIKDILIKMICNAWYPINYFKLSFGYSDKLSENIFIIRKKLNISIDISLDELFRTLKNSDNIEINRLIFHFEQLVPYRFLSPWITGTKREVINLSQSYSSNCLYGIYVENEKYIKINSEWEDYLYFNNKILFDFAYWNLLKYIQLRNPNVPNISNKLIKPSIRINLAKQRNFWNIIFDEVKHIECIYTGKSLTKNDYDLEHFIPWSFVSHNQIWNLIPVDSSINSSKSNKLPKLDKYFDRFVSVQYKAIKQAFNKNPRNKILEDYLILGESIEDIVGQEKDIFSYNYKKIISPLIQIASNSGFEFWNF